MPSLRHAPGIPGIQTRASGSIRMDDTTSSLTVFTMDLDDLRQRVETACEAIARVRARLHPLLEQILEVPLKVASAHDTGAIVAAEGEPSMAAEQPPATAAAPPQEGRARQETDPAVDRAERDQAFAALGQCIELVTALLPGLVSLTPEERRRMEANRPDKEAMDEFLENYVPPPRLPDTAPTAEELMVERARDLGRRSELIHRVQAAFQPLVKDLMRAHDLLNLRLGRFGVSAEPTGNN
jgi:hypothetical protein